MLQLPRLDAATGTAAGPRPAARTRYALAASVHTMKSSRAGTKLALRKQPLTASATAVNAAPTASHRGSAPVRRDAIAIAAQKTASGNRLITVAPSSN